MKIPTGSSGKPLRMVIEPDTITYRGEKYGCMYVSFRDDQLDEGYTTTESDTVWLNQVTNQYREKHGIPYQDEIIGLRERYGISAAKMSVILGFGVNQYRLYEDGEVPSESNGKMIRGAMNPQVFLELVKSSRNQLTEKEFTKISARVKEEMAQEESRHHEALMAGKLFPGGRGLANGFAPISVFRLKNLLLYWLEQMGETSPGKMNQVLFYTDFLSYRERGIAISGLAYQALECGPVPRRWDRVYSAFDEVEVQLKLVQGQDCIFLKSNTEADMSGFSVQEMAIIDEVCAKVKDLALHAIMQMCQKEPAWKGHVGKAETIPFREAFSLVEM